VRFTFRRALVLSLAAGFLLALPTLRLGLLLDDDFHRALIGGLAYPHRPLDLYAFAPGDPSVMQGLVERGPFPWFTPPGLKLSFFRPLACALLYLDVWLFGATAWAAHLHSIAWYLALIAVAALVYRKVLPGPLAPFALLLFAIDGTHAIPAGWLANRHALVAAVAALLGVWAHLKWRTAPVHPPVHPERRAEGPKSKGPLVLSALAYAIALCTSEAALPALLYVPAFEAFGATGPRRERLRALLPLALVVGPWALFYRAMGYGSSGSGIYLDPASDPLHYLLTAAPRLSALLGALTVGLPSDFWLDANARPVLIAAGVLGMGFTAWLAARLWPTFDAPTRRTLWWLGAGAVLGILPSVAVFPSDRLLLVPSFGALAVFAAFLQALWAQRAKLAAKFALAVLGAAHLLFPIAGWALSPTTLTQMARAVERAAFEPRLSQAQLSRRLIAFAAPDFAQTLYLGLARRREGLPLPESWNVLSFAPYPHLLTRTAERSFELEVVGGSMFGTVYEQMLRSESLALEAGHRVRLWHAWVTVLESDGYHVRRLRLDLDDGPDAWQFVQWREGRVVPLELPAVGAQLLLARHKGAFDL
jgi:hypothetical protein